MYAEGAEYWGVYPPALYAGPLPKGCVLASSHYESDE